MTRNFPGRHLVPASIEEIRRELRQRAKLCTASRWTGVYRPRKSTKYPKPWRVVVKTPAGRLVEVGHYATENEAALVHDRATLFYRGDNGRLNFPDEALRLGAADIRTLRAECARAQKTTTSSRFRGVTWNAQGQNWRAVISHERQSIRLGLYDDEREAALAYDAEARKLHGARAKLNFPPAAKRASCR